MMYCVFHLGEKNAQIPAKAMANGYTVCWSCAIQIYKTWSANPTYTFLEVISHLELN
jgi:hypothetical protein